MADIWLTHILSEADHRLNHVQPWAEQRLDTLRGCTQRPVRGLDLTDDRLASVLPALSDDARWVGFERALSRELVRVYDLQPASVRVDSTTASGYWQVTEDGLFQFGHSKDHRPDLPQVKVMLATLDPLGLPVAAAVVAGTGPTTRSICRPSPACAQPGPARAAVCRATAKWRRWRPARIASRPRWLPVSAAGSPVAADGAGGLPGDQQDGALPLVRISGPGGHGTRSTWPMASSRS